jgi:hypothetical protein
MDANILPFVTTSMTKYPDSRKDDLPFLRLSAFHFFGEFFVALIWNILHASAVVAAVVATLAHHHEFSCWARI